MYKIQDFLERNKSNNTQLLKLMYYFFSFYLVFFSDDDFPATSDCDISKVPWGSTYSELLFSSNHLFIWCLSPIAIVNFFIYYFGGYVSETTFVRRKVWGTSPSSKSVSCMYWRLLLEYLSSLSSVYSDSMSLSQCFVRDRFIGEPIVMDWKELDSQSIWIVAVAFFMN